MLNLFSSLLRLGITVSVSDRETFVNKVSEFIEGLEQKPENAERWAKALADYLEDTKSNINLENSIKNAVSNANLPDNEKIEKLIDAIRELTHELQQHKAKK